MIEQLAASLTVSQAFKSLIQVYKKRGISTYQINDGWCEDLAEQVIKTVDPNHSKGLVDVQIESFMIENPRGNTEFDIPLLKKWWPRVKPPIGETWNSLNRKDFSGHVWVTDNKLHYDAEAPNGVANFFDLPIFKRRL